MTPTGNSFKKYQYDMPFTGSGNVSNDYNRNHSATQKPMDGWRGNTDFGNILNGSQKFNTTDWNKSYTRDPLANFGSSNSSGSSFASIMSKIMLGLTGLVAGFGLFSMVKDLFGKKNKADAEATSPQNFNADAQTSLNDLSNTAEGYDENSDVTQMAQTSTNLGNSITASKTQRDNLKRDSETADKTKDTLEGKRPELVNALQTFDTGKKTLETNISSITGKLGDPNLSPEDKASLQNELAQMKKELNEKYSDTKRKTLADQVTENGKGIAAQEKIIADNKTKVSELDTQIKDAEKAKKSLDKKIQKKDKD